MNSLAVYLALTLLYQTTAYAAYKRQDHLFKQMMSVYEQIRRFGCQAQFAETTLYGRDSERHISIGMTQHADTLAHLPLQAANDLLGVVYVYLAWQNDMVHIGNAHRIEPALAVQSDRPAQERPDSKRIVSQERLEIEYTAVVERHHDTHVMQTGSIALQILDRVSEGMKHEWRIEEQAGIIRHALQQIVVISVNTGYHVASGIAQQAGDGRLLSAPQHLAPLVQARRKEYLKIAAVVLKLAQDRTPEQHIIIALDVCNDFPPGVLRCQRISCCDIL